MPGFCWGTKKSGVVSTMGLASLATARRAVGIDRRCAKTGLPSVSCRLFEGKLYPLLVAPRNVLPPCLLNGPPDVLAF